MSSQKALMKIHLRDNGDVFLMSEYEFENKLCLQILNIDRNEAYIGEVSDFNLRAQAASIRLTFSDFMRKATNALFERTPPCSNFLYCLDKKDEHYIFKWKSVDHEETIINLGNVEMNKRNANFVLKEVLQSISEEMHKLNSNMLKMSAELDESKNQTFEAIKQLSLATEAKESIEKQMYSKFILVLNEKKRKIKEFQANPKSISDSNNNKSRKKKTKISHHPLSSDSSDIEGDMFLNQPGPSNANGRNSLIFLDDNKPVVPAPQNKIRNRKVPVHKKSHPAEKFTAGNPTSSSFPTITKEDDSDDLLSCL